MPGSPLARKALALIFAFALANGILYALLLPLWEGFDEAFHYAYVQELSVLHTVPGLGRSNLSSEVWRSLTLAPVSHVVKANIPELMTFREYLALPRREREQMRTQLKALSPEQWLVSRPPHPNYEAHQAPLAYCLLALPDILLRSHSLLVRIRAIRIFAVTISILLTGWAAWHLGMQAQIKSPYRELILFLVFSSQMFYATSARVSNDWLAVPLSCWLLVAAIRLCAEPNRANAFAFALLNALGLLTKAYFLAFIPLAAAVFCALMARRRLSKRIAVSSILLMSLIAGPWYVRNILVNGAFTGMQEEAAGIGVKRVLAGMRDVPWLSSAAYMARASLWTGNNSFTTFSRLTLNCLLCLLAFGIVCYVTDLRDRRADAVDVVVASAIGLFSLALAYETALEFVNTHGASAGASPWYMQILLVPVILLAIRGLSYRPNRWRRLLAFLHIALWTYVVFATYLLKLIPQYSGYDLAHTGVISIVRWYFQSARERNDILSTTALAGPMLLYTLVALVLILGSTAALMLSSQILANGIQTQIISGRTRTAR